MAGKRGDVSAKRVAINLSPEEFAREFERVGAQGMATMLDITLRNIFERRRKVEAQIGRKIWPPKSGGTYQERTPPEKTTIDLTVKDGVVIVGSDAHYWPGMISTAHAGLIEAIGRLKPSAVIMNGDIVDGASLSRHAPIAHEYKPRFIDELDACQARLSEIEAVAGKARLIWPAGNHDLRFESRIADVLPELAGVKGAHLKDHFPKWEPCWLTSINNSAVVKHRFKGGLHAAFNNALWSGRTIVTGHLHKGIIYPLTDWNGTRYGVDAPTLAEPEGRQFVDYTEANPKNWRSGFVVLTWIDGILCQPELALVHDVGVIEFRGERRRV
jgi:hypothetical protein